jgi:predicted nucleic acid-binding protein
VKGAAVVDASVALAWLLPGEATDVALALRQKAVDRPALALLVPPLFWYEIRCPALGPRFTDAEDRARMPGTCKLANRFLHLPCACL